MHFGRCLTLEKLDSHLAIVSCNSYASLEPIVKCSGLHDAGMPQALKPHQARREGVRLDHWIASSCKKTYHELAHPYRQI